MSEVLQLCRHLPVMQLAAGETLLEEGRATGRMYVLIEGAFEVRRAGVVLVSTREPGAFLGEISVLLGTGPMASVVALVDSRVYLIDQAASVVRDQPELMLAIARLLARRLTAISAYLVDIKRQYADSGTHLALMDQVLGNLVAMTPTGLPIGSERSDVPDY